MKNRISVLFLITTIPFIFAGVCDGPTPGPVDGGLYHTYQEIVDELTQLQTRFPQISKLTEIGKSIENRKILAIKISDSANIEESEPEILLVGGHHAREWISVDVPFLIAKYLLENYDADSRIKNLVDSSEIWIVPMLNPDGHQYSVTDDRLWRKNRHNNGDGSFGVDLNRNYSYKWGGTGSSSDTYSETYRGPEAFSEPESKAIQNLASQHKFVAMIAYHNFSQLVLFPWGYTNSPAPDKTLLNQLAETMADSIKKVHGVSYTPQQSAQLYAASGDATDWLYGETQAPSFTIELRPRSSSPGFVLPESELFPTFEENLPAALFLIDWTQKIIR